MKKNNILLSTGTILWMNVKQAIFLAKETGFDGIELVPSRQIIKGIKHILNQTHLGREKTHISYFKHIKGVHHSWRLDIGHDLEYGLPFLLIPFFTIIRFFFFPKVKESRAYISTLSKTLNMPVTVHKISPTWVLNDNGKEFEGGVLYELIGNYSKSKESLKSWLEDNKHNIVVDTRDDQSVIWGRRHGFYDWKELWQWIGLSKIKNIQLTLIGKKGLTSIFNRSHSLAEEQLLWLHEHKWKGTVTAEANPLAIFLLCRGNIKNGLTEIASFIRKTLIEGKKWS